MGDFEFDRAFNRTAAMVAKAQAALAKQAQPTVVQQAKEEQHLRKLTTNMTVEDAIKRILLAYTDRDYFRLLELPRPELDALGRLSWSASSIDVSRAYRKLSILVHPDKNPGEEARKAFEALNEAHRKLKDPNMLESILKEENERAKSRREETEATATLDQRVLLNAKQKEEAARLRKEHSEQLNQEIVRQMKEKQDKAKKKRPMAESKYTRREQEMEDGDGGNEEEEKPSKAGMCNKLDEDNNEEEAAKRRKALARKRQKLRKQSVL